MRAFQDRAEAGRVLAAKVAGRVELGEDILVLALPRGGVPVAYEVACALHAPLDVFLVRKLGVPGREELAMGAIASGGVRVLNEDVVRFLNISPDVIESVVKTEQAELERRAAAYREGRPAPEVGGKTVILIDDGLATGATMRAAARAVRQQGPKRLIIAVPVGSPDTCESFQSEADAVVCGATPEPFLSVGYWYEDFSQTSDAEVSDLLRRAAPGVIQEEQTGTEESR